MLDVNGTTALDGELVPGVGERLNKLGGVMDPWLAAAKVIPPGIEAALDLLLMPRRLVATLRA